MTDRELLENAAKAAGLRIHRWWIDVAILYDPKTHEEGAAWNPLTQDGDALRLAVKLCITDLAECVGRTVFEEGEQPDIYATTRRAIVRAAAKIGESL